MPPRVQFIRAGSSGMKYGLILALGTIALEMGYKKVFGGDDPHGHGHGHGDGHH